jgi:hypothetical protein
LAVPPALSLSLVAEAAFLTVTLSRTRVAPGVGLSVPVFLPDNVA